MVPALPNHMLKVGITDVVTYLKVEALGRQSANAISMASLKGAILRF